MAKRSNRRKAPGPAAAAARPPLPLQRPPVLRGRTVDPLRRPFATLQATGADCAVRCSRLTGLARDLCIQQCLHGRPAV